MNAPTTAEYCIARTIFACNDHGRGGREYWDHDAVTWRFTTTSDDRVSLELYAQKGASGPGPQAAGYDTTRLLGTWDLGPLAQLDLVLSGQLAANGLRLGRQLRRPRRRGRRASSCQRHRPFCRPPRLAHRRVW